MALTAIFFFTELEPHNPLPLSQMLHWDGRVLQVTIAAMPSFVSERRTTLPAFVLAFAVVTVFIIAVLIGEPALHFLLCQLSD